MLGDAVACCGAVARAEKQWERGELVGLGDMAGMAMSSLALSLPRVLWIIEWLRGNQGTIGSKWCRLG